MNLAIDYLIRTGAVIDLFELPCVLFLQNELGKCRAVGAEQLDDGSGVLIKHWCLSKSDEKKQLPLCKTHKIHKKDLFLTNKLIPKGFRPLRYLDEPIPRRYNEPTHPMDELYYRDFYGHLLSSQKHYRFKHDWLWNAFANLYLQKSLGRQDRMEVNASIRQLYVAKEQDQLAARSPDQWEKWLMWKSNLLVQPKHGTPVAEIVFRCP